MKGQDHIKRFGYNDPELVHHRPKWTFGRSVALVFALLFITGVWFALDQKLLFGGDWISPTYDNENWRTNEGDLHTYGAWDLESHVWKTEYIMENFPNFQYNPYWYLGMPLIKYYQYGFYALHALTIWALGVSPARASLLLVIFAHLAATFLTFLLCYKMSRRIWISALCSIFVLANTFISLRSYGWEPITVVFLFLYPLGLLLFFREPLRPFRLSLILLMAITYYSHPLLFFALAMTMGLYLLSIAVRNDLPQSVVNKHYIWHYFGLLVAALGLGAVQFFLQMSYTQVSSGAHMGVSYLPFYQVPFNIITLKDFFFDAGNLKGPGFVIMVATVLLLGFLLLDWFAKRRGERFEFGRSVTKHPLALGLGFTVFMMVLFYYLELWNVFPMNILRSIQYHRIIPEFIIAAAALVAVLYNVVGSRKQQVFYYTMLISFVLASGVVIYGVQAYWDTTPSISHNQEFIYEEFEGRLSNPYSDQSLAVRNSFTKIPQVYGYYEQGITNPYADELFSVSSGYHRTDRTILYLKAANVARLYTNMEEGTRDEIVRGRLNGSLEHVWNGEDRYAYFKIPLEDPHMAEAVSALRADEVLALEPGCRVLFEVEYCGSVGEEFVNRDPAEAAYLQAYVDMLEEPHAAKARYTMIDPDHHRVVVTGATDDTAVVVKMSYDEDFVATIDGREVPVEQIGPYFMMVRPGISGDYDLMLEYQTPKEALVGLGVSVVTLLLLLVYFALGRPFSLPRRLRFPEGDM